MAKPSDPSDEEIWKTYAKGVKRLDAHEEDKEKKPPPRPSSPPCRAEEPEQQEPPPVTPEIPAQPQMPLDQVVLDMRVEYNMRQGDVIVEARLDLHGKTFQEAHETLSGFIETQARRGKRMLLVITGKGREGEASLRTDVPRWCDAMPLGARILALRPAAPCHGGEGAWYVMLKRRGTVAKDNRKEPSLC